jgi:ATP-dependent RNA helicase RhlB
LFGGADFEHQKRVLATQVIDVVVATPGRLLDFKGRGDLDLKHVEVLVIDEADRMLDMGFIPDVRRIIRGTPPKTERQTMIFSATLTSDVMRLAEEWMPAPTIVEVEPEQVSADSIEEKVYMVTSRDKFTLLYNLLQRPEFSRVLIFGNRRIDTERIADRLGAHGVTCALLSGDVPQNKRISVLEEFRSGKTRVLVATDVAGRGLHVEGVSHVINYDLPYEPQDYVHRIGRTGRAGAAGIAISFACENESFILPEIEKMTGECIPCIMPDDALLAHPPPASRALGPSSHARRPDRPQRPGGGRSLPRTGRRPFRSAR